MATEKVEEFILTEEQDREFTNGKGEPEEKEGDE